MKVLRTSVLVKLTCLLPAFKSADSELFHEFHDGTGFFIDVGYHPMG